MFYIPNAFKVDTPVCRTIVRDHPLATITSVGRDGESVDVSFAPVLWREDEIVFHLAASNAHAQELDGHRRVVMVFKAGDGAYISPEVESPSAVPTWNYAAVRVEGFPTPESLPEAKMAILTALSESFEAARPTPWHPTRLSTEAFLAMTSAIVAFRMKVLSVQGKVKLSQNKPTHIALANQSVSPDLVQYLQDSSRK